MKSALSVLCQRQSHMPMLLMGPTPRDSMKVYTCVAVMFHVYARVARTQDMLLPLGLNTGLCKQVLPSMPTDYQM